MNSAQIAPVVATAGLVLIVAAVVALLVTRAGRRRWQAQLDAARADVEALTARLDAIDSSPTHLPSAAADVPAQGFVITSLPGDPAALHLAEPVADRETSAGASAGLPAGAGAALTAGQFATVAVGESLVRLVSLGYGRRRAMSAESRNRIRFEMRREVKRARRQRRRDLKEAKRHLRHVATGSAEDAA
jgi:hypothetical protein